MKRLTGLALGAVVAGMMWASGPARGEEFALTAVEPGMDDAIMMMEGLELVFPTEGKPKGLKKAPEDFGEGGKYFEAEIGGGKCIVAVAGEKLYVDTNMNGDLTDEKAIVVPKTMGKAGGTSDYRPSSLGAIRVNPGEGRPEVRVWLEWVPLGILELRPAGMARGDVSLGGEDYVVTVIDGNKNGKFEGWGSKDMIAVKPKREKEAGTATVAGGWPMQTPKMLRNSKGEYYEIAVKENGTGIGVKRAHPKMGSLRVKSLEGELTVSSEYGEETLTIPQEKQTLAAGQYSLQGIKLRQKDAEGHEWTISGGWREKRTIEISEGKETEVVLGQPFTAKTEVQKREDTAYIVAMELKGVGGETYQAGASKDGKQEPAPKMKVVAKSGLTLLSASFEYG